MELNKCSRCGAFYVSKGDVCPKCVAKDNLELSNFKTYVEKNGYTTSLEYLSVETGIATKNLTRYLNYVGFKGYVNTSDNSNNEITIN